MSNNAPEDHKTTPLMEQYLEIKMANPDSMLFFRMGDFYELFFEDAEQASRALGIALTKRGKYMGQDVPLAGVPIHTADDYLQRLIGLGFRVAVCEQIEDPAEARKRGYKSIVKRDVVRLVTKGTITEDNLLPTHNNNYLLAVAHIKSIDEWGLAWLDLSTGEFKTSSSSLLTLASDVARVNPSEIVGLDSQLHELRALLDLKDLTPLTRDYFDSSQAESRLKAHYKLFTLESFGAFSKAELTACAALTAYIERTQKGKKAPLQMPSREQAGAVMLIDAATRANLELTRRMSGERAGSLLACIDKTITQAGARALHNRLSAPLTDVEAIHSRLDAVAYFYGQSELLQELRDILKRAPDMARAITRLSLERGSPRDLFAIKQGLLAANAIVNAAQEPPACEWSGVYHALLVDKSSLTEALDEALSDSLPLLKRDGGFIKPNFDPDLDATRLLKDRSHEKIAALQADYAQECDVKTLKIKHNNVLGFFIEVTQQHGEKMLAPPLNALFIHRQTLAGVMRFSTPNLSQLEASIAGASEKALAIELKHFARLESLVLEETSAIQTLAENLALLDVMLSNAVLARELNLVKPLIDDSLTFKVKAGRHLVVEQALARETPFIANDCSLSDGNHSLLCLMTGPNMAGKSTFLRQNALIAVLAQAGIYVPAKECHIGVIDKLFSRVGASDDLARGRSTFMVEMVETATILNQATPQSLVILDEIGRGTATFDGLSIAWGTLEFLHDSNKARALFATHFHELTALSTRLKRLKNITLQVKEFQGDVIFLHHVVEGVADKSYGLQVAKLAGLPTSVVARARTILNELESTDKHAHMRKLLDDLPLFAAVAPVTQRKNPVLELLEGIQPDDLSPKEALALIYELKKQHSLP